MLIGLLTPTAGTIEVDGIDVIKTPRLVRDHIGYMGQKVSLYQGLSLRENLEFYAGLYGMAGAPLEECWGELRERFAPAEVEHEKASDLPAGVRQRAGLALSTPHACVLFRRADRGRRFHNACSLIVSARRRDRVRSSSRRISSRRSSTATGPASSTPDGLSRTPTPTRSAAASRTGTA
jgi:hypothetical protein